MFRIARNVEPRRDRTGEFQIVADGSAGAAAKSTSALLIAGWNGNLAGEVGRSGSRRPDEFRRPAAAEFFQ